MQGLLGQSVYYTHMHIHVHYRYPDVHVLLENNMYVPWYPNNGLSLHMSAKGDMALKQCTIQTDSSIWLCCH